MGRQIQISMLATDANHLVNVLRSWGDHVEVVVQTGNSSEPESLSHITDDINQPMILWNKRFARTIERRYIASANPPYYRIDEQVESVLEISPSRVTEWEGRPALTQGRIYGTFDNKQPEFEKWYERVVRHIRRHWRKNPISWLGGYIGPAASEWFDAGGLLLPVYVPPIRSDWIQRLDEQHQG
jgi:hypothetical protein